MASCWSSGRRSSALLVAAMLLAACDEPKPRGPGSDGTVVELGRLIAKSLPGGARRLSTPTWAKPLIGRPLFRVAPQPLACVGNTDGVVGTDRSRQVVGWGWEVSARRRVDRVVLVNAHGRVAAAGEGGAPRPDVPAARPDIPDGLTGWGVAIGGLSGTFSAYGVQGRAACPLGRIEVVSTP